MGAEIYNIYLHFTDCVLILSLVLKCVGFVTCVVVYIFFSCYYETLKLDDESYSKKISKVYLNNICLWLYTPDG